ncbi:TIGR04066 family peptide maturation system protein [Petralouisia muris]|uniref:TIGR04066 family peptide maturation system protein n=1 Tax=Petralouisia muris TaxID=3032872 RepID=A0AC61RQ12_9FIRM|nr:TIGR04066 family peptide maturation system protein [Petralouisia muris]TGY91101.1 TIGR04066 family peptide maturation system protein [Petralouisia muris]
MKKLAIFPFIYEYRELIMYSDYIKNYELTSCITLNEADTQCLRKEFGAVSSIRISEEFDGAIEDCDIVLYMYNPDILLGKEEYQNKIARTRQLGKDVLFSRECHEYLYSEEMKENSILDAGNWNINIFLDEKVQYLKSIEIPAIGIMGLGRFCNKFCTELEVCEFFKAKGYKVLHFGSKEWVNLYGGRLIPGFIFERSVSVTTRILKWNQYLFDVCNKEQPDLVIIGMPGGIMPLNNKILNDYGEVPFILANGIKMDIGILCAFFYEQVDEKYFDEYRNYCKYKMNCPVDFINISNTSCRFNLDSQESILEYLHYKNNISNYTVITGKVEGSSEIYNILDENSRKKLLTRIYEQLTSGVSVF